jgi:hypothetical protein
MRQLEACGRRQSLCHNSAEATAIPKVGHGRRYHGQSPARPGWDFKIGCRCFRCAAFPRVATTKPVLNVDGEKVGGVKSGADAFDNGALANSLSSAERVWRRQHPAFR